MGAVSAASLFPFPALSSLANFSTLTALTTVLDFIAVQSFLALTKLTAMAHTGETAGGGKNIFYRKGKPEGCSHVTIDKGRVDHYVVVNYCYL